MFHTALDFNDKISIVNRHRAGKKKVKELVSQILIQMLKGKPEICYGYKQQTFL